MSATRTPPKTKVMRMFRNFPRGRRRMRRRKPARSDTFDPEIYQFSLNRMT